MRFHTKDTPTIYCLPCIINYTHIVYCMERVMGIEPTRPAWKAGILPLNYTRIECFIIISPLFIFVKYLFSFFKHFFENYCFLIKQIKVGILNLI